MKLSPAFKRKCEGMAVDWRSELQLRAFDALPAELMLGKLNGQAVTPDNLEVGSLEARECLMRQNDWSAGIVRPKPLLIVYHPAHALTRRQSSLMHEIAHVLLDHQMIGFHPETGLPMRDAKCEDEATYLGSCLQIPRRGLEWASQRGLSTTEIAAHFGASEKMVLFRSNMTGIAVMSND